MARLVIQAGPHKGMSFEIRRPKFSVGRDLVNDVQLLFPKVSRVHAEIMAGEGGDTLYDRQSRNGTTVNGLAVETAVLRDGDEIGIGDTLFVYQAEAADASRSRTKVFRDGGAAGETVVASVAGWNADLLKKNLRSGSTLQHEHTKKFLVELFELGRALHGIDDPRALLRRAGGLIATAVKADRVFPALRDADAADGWEVLALEPGDRAGSLAHAPISRSVFKQAAEERTAIAVHQGQDASASMTANDIRTALCVPVAHEGDRGELLGLLYADRMGQAEDFSRLELEFVTAAAVVVADALRAAEAVRALAREAAALRGEVRARHSIVGGSAALERTLAFIDKAAGASATVLIMGASGTGKELIARAIHDAGARADRAFHTVNCAAIPETLLESELFGHVKGAYTGADTERRGMFEEADGGTLFLDEIGDMPATGQAKLLRVIEQGELTRVGSARVIRVDVRVIAATNKDLDKESAAGRFRADLFHRLNVLTLAVPPLRERTGDVRILLDHFIARYAAECGRRLTFTPEAVKLLEAHAWPGNVRELRNLVERLCILAPADTITPADLPPAIQARDGADAGGGLSLEAVTQAHIRKVLDLTAGNKKKAAEILGIDRSTLYARLGGAAKEDEA
ncbi:MAG: sigma 54-interacting transcriptional regulator [Planctomycetota bacterium]